MIEGHGGWHYNTIQQAADDGAVVMPYGCILWLAPLFNDLIPSLSLFLTNLFRFFCIGFSLYGLARLYAAITDENIIKKTVKCAYCRKEVSAKVWFVLDPRVDIPADLLKAKRCYLCTSWLDGREDNH